MQKDFFLEKIPINYSDILKCSKKVSFFKNTISSIKIYPKKRWFKKFEDFWSPSEENALKQLKNFLKNIENYSDARNYPGIIGTSKLSPFIKHGQIHVETIWEECNKLKKSGANKFLAEIGWREFNHTLINNFPHMIKEIIQKNLINFHGYQMASFYLLGKKV